jgi:hypothetical protein
LIVFSTYLDFFFGIFNEIYFPNYKCLISDYLDSSDNAGAYLLVVNKIKIKKNQYYKYLFISDLNYRYLELNRYPGLHTVKTMSRIFISDNIYSSRVIHFYYENQKFTKKERVRLKKYLVEKKIVSRKS